MRTRSHPDLAVVTGAFSYTGRYVARRLIDQGVRVRTLTRHRDGRREFGDRVQAAPLDFSDPEGLRRSMQGASVFYNTYWIRFPRGQTGFDHAVENSRTLFDAAEKAGVERVVHLSVSNASLDSRLPYIRAKAQVEEILEGLAVPCAIIRPTLIFGAGDLLLNNMAWALRRFPIYPVFGKGDYAVQPVHAGDVAAQAVEAGSHDESSIADAAGPETFSYEALIRLIASAVGVRARLVRTPPSVGLALTRLVGVMVRDVVLTRNEVDELMAGLFTSGAAPTGTTRLSDWLQDNSDTLGLHYVSELRRNFRQADTPTPVIGRRGPSARSGPEVERPGCSRPST